MYRVTFVSSFFPARAKPRDRALSHRILQVWLDALVETNVLVMREAKERGTPLPPLYSSGVVYREEPKGVEEWLDCLEIVRRGFDDCEGLGCFRAAELRVQGLTNARAVWKYWQNPVSLSQTYHIVTHYAPPIGGFKFPEHAKPIGNGIYEEDPSKVLGMSGEA
ncbi:MAG: hypothetical protein E6Q97_20495 [Desulfurellales bacterium]|nr:MAG: hypothetical protein E6Q97_20495 [Desulfurellales bacterium]